VPDAGHARVIAKAHAEDSIAAVPLTTEEEGIGYLAGAWLGGVRGVLLMQSSGVGNCINTLALAAQARFPLLMLVTMRGEWAELNPWQNPAGGVAEESMRLMGVRTGRADRPERGGPALQPEPVRAGMLKAGVGYWRIDPFERRVLAAVGAAAAATGVPVMVHTEYGSAAWEVLDALAAAGVAADRVVLAHIDRNLDPGLHAELTAAGAYLGCDGMARHREAPDSAILDCLAKVAAAGDPDRLLLGGDVARRSRYRSYGGIPGLDYLPTRFLPRLRRELGDALVDRMLVANPARLLSLRT